MAESQRVRRVMRWRVTALGLALALAFSVLTTGSATASPLAQFRAMTKGPLLVPGVFRLPASNGYTLYVVGIPPRDRRPGQLLITASTKGKSVHYFAPATVTETSMQANLGALGEISVVFQRSNQAVTIPCGKREIALDSGQYVGKIDFHGEEGFTSVEAATVPGNAKDWLAGICGEEGFLKGSTGRDRGTELYVRNPTLGPELNVTKHRPGAAAAITVWTSEYSNGIAIERLAALRMPGRDFTFDSRLRIATVRPPAPFSGSARFDLGKKAGQRWSGDLTVDLPGRSDLPLTGPALRATLKPSE